MLPPHARFVFILVAAIPLAALAENFVTAKGQTVAMPEISSLTCEQIEGTLAKIDSTRYRENAPVPHDRADEPLHVYEENLAKALFRVCVVEPRAVMDPRSAVDPGESLRQQVGTE